MSDYEKPKVSIKGGMKKYDADIERVSAWTDGDLKFNYTQVKSRILARLKGERDKLAMQIGKKKV